MSSDLSMNDSAGDEALATRALDPQTPPLEAGRLMRELLNRELARGAPEPHARRRLASRFGVARDMVDERLQLAARSEEDSEAAERLSRLKGRARGGHVAPLGISGYRAVLRLPPVLRREVLTELEARDAFSYRELLEIIDRARVITRASSAPASETLGRLQGATTEDLLHRVRSRNTHAVQAGLVLQELAKRARQDGTLPSARKARKHLADMLQVSADWVGERMLLAQRAASDQQTMAQAAKLQLRPSALRALLRLDLREHRRAVLRRLEHQGKRPATYREVVAAIRATEPARTDVQEHRVIDRRSRMTARASVGRVSLLNAIPRVLDAYRRSGGPDVPDGPELALQLVVRLLAEDLAELSRHL
jgi:hypothetical protein